MSIQMKIELNWCIIKDKLVMDEQKAKTQKTVHTLTSFAEMRFTPSQVFKKANANANELVGKIKTMMKWSKRGSDPNSKNNETQESDSPVAPPLPHEPQLEYVLKLNAEHILIGNRNQLDLIAINSATHYFLDTMYLWNISIDAPIDYLCVERKKSLLILGSKFNKKISVFRYDSKKINRKPVRLTQFTLLQPPEQICVMKDLLIIFDKQKIVTYTITSTESIIKKSEHEFQFPVELSYELLKVPQPIDSTLNIFFTSDKPHSSLFTLWMIELQYFGKDVILSKPELMYEIKQALKKKIKIKSTENRGNFIMNLGEEILAFKKGYIIDSVNITSKIENSHLKYLGKNVLTHFSRKRFEIYDYQLDTHVKPEKINIKPIDSMEITLPENSQYFDALPVFNKNFLVILQINPAKNKKRKGEFNYWLAITQPVLIEHKIDILFPVKRLQLLSGEDLEDRIEMAAKMGMSNREIYLELWNRSSKKESNFTLLLNTRHYKSIQEEIVKLLKKKSMNLSEIFKVQRSSLQMLKESLFQNCTIEVFFGYISCSYLLKKLEYFRDVVIMYRSNEEDKNFSPLMISIKKYNQIQEMHLMNYVIEMAKNLCLEGKPVENELRLYLEMFRFQLIPVYKDLLEDLIKALGSQFLKLITIMPEILPYQYSPKEKESLPQLNLGPYQGIWKPITPQEYSNSNCIENISTIDNRDVIGEGIKELRFRRANMFGHCLITEPIWKVKEQLKQLNSEQIFYHVIEIIMKEVELQEDRHKIFAYIEEKYACKLEHLQNRINLYNIVFSYLNIHRILPYNEQKKRAYTFKQFFSLKDDQLFQHFFRIEKARKGLILREIKPIFEERSKPNSNLFNEVLLNYLKSQISEISDIKYLLNRINNEKKEFHLVNQDMYAVLVESMIYKLKIGTECDIPLSEILIYVENVPIEKSNRVMDHLAVIHAINRNSELISEAKVNMSIIQIMENPQKLMIGIIDHLLRENNMFSEPSADTQLQISYQILANLEFIHNQICKDVSETIFYIFFIYLVRLADNRHMFKHIMDLINDQYLSKEFVFDASICESLVVYLYKSKLNETPAYVSNIDYLRNLISLLPEDNEIREYIICEYQIASMLSTQAYYVEYPLSYRNSSLGFSELEVILSRLKIEDISRINIEELATLITQMYTLNTRICSALEFIEDEEKNQLMSSVFFRNGSSELTHKQIYEAFMMRILSLHRITQLLPIMDAYFDDKEEILPSDIVYPILLLLEMTDDINYESKQLFFLACCYLFKEPDEFFYLIRNFILTPFNTKERNDFLRNEILKYKEGKSIGFDIENRIIREEILRMAVVDRLQSNLFELLFNTFKHLCNSRNDFRHFSFSFIYAILINSPYILSKFLFSSRKFNSVRNIRLFLTYLMKEKVFDQLVALEVGHRIFNLLIYCLRDQMEMEEVAHRFIEYPLTDDLPEDFEPKFDDNIEYFLLAHRSSEAFKKEKKNRKRKMSEKEDQVLEDNGQGQKGMLLQPQGIVDAEPIEYSDWDISESASERKSMVIIPRKHKKFNEAEEIKKAINSKVKGKKNVSPILQKRVIKKKAFEEDEDEPSPMIRIFPESDNNTNNPEGLFQDFSKSEIAEARDIDEFEVDFSDSNIFLRDNKLKDLIKKSTLSARDDKSEINDDFSEMPSYLQAEEQEDEVGPIQETHAGNVYYDRNENSANFGQIKEKIQAQIQAQIQAKSEAPRSEKQIERSGEISSRSRKKSLSKNDDQSSIQFNEGAGVEKYTQIDGYPSPEGLGLKLYQQNLIAFESAMKHKFKIDLVLELEKKDNFSAYMKEVFKYLYYQSNDSSIEGIINFFELLICKLKLPFSTNNLAIWKRGEKLYKRYDSGKDLRQVMPIEPIFEPNAKPIEIYKLMESRIIEFINDDNIFKMAKMIGMIFQHNQIEEEIIYNYFLIISQRSIDEQDTQAMKLELQRVDVAIKKITIKILIDRFAEYYSRSNVSKKSVIMSKVMERVKKEGSLEERIQLFEQVVEYDSSFSGFLDKLRRNMSSRRR